MQPPEQPGYYSPQRPQSTGAQKVTAWSAGMIALVIAGPIVLLILCCVVDILGGVFNSIFGGGGTDASTP